MSERARTIVSRLRQFFLNRRLARRRVVRVPCTLSLADRRLSPNGSRGVPTIGGHTVDISATGLALNVPAIRIDEHYLVGDNRRLQVILELPIGPVELQVTPVRYESLEEDELEKSYTIGVRITEMNEKDRAQFNEYVQRFLKRSA